MMLSEIDHRRTGDCFKVLGGVECDATKQLVAFDLRRNFWRTRGLVVQNVGMLHLSVFPVCNWCAATRPWTKHELAEARTMLRMCRRALNLWPTSGEQIQDDFRRTARWSERVMAAAKGPRWDETLLSGWWS